MVEIRKMTTADLNMLQKIGIETYKDTFDGTTSDEDMDAYLEFAYNLPKLAGELANPDSFHYFIMLDEKIAGYLKLNINDAQTENFAPDALEVQRIYIRKAYKRHGLGKMLIDLADKRAHELGRDSIWLGVWEFNFPAQKFYQSMGYKRVGEHRFVMGDEIQTDFIMQRHF